MKKKMMSLAKIGYFGMAFMLLFGVNGQAYVDPSVITYLIQAVAGVVIAIGAVVGLIGGVKVYGKFSSGDPDTSKTAASWFGACIFLIVAATILRSFFL